jgi:hypothetical protein
MRERERERGTPNGQGFVLTLEFGDFCVLAASTEYSLRS